MRRLSSTIIKYLTVISAILGTALALVFAVRDGYSHPLYRLLYFTNLSNIWIALSFVSVLIIPLVRIEKRDRYVSAVYTLKFIFTVSITITGIVFLTVLAPFARGYNPWTFSNVLTHVVTPILAIADLFVDARPLRLKSSVIFYSALPPFVYLVFSSILSLLRVDFGRGDPFPYFFLNYYSPAGVFGFSNEPPYIIGSFYWIVIFLAIVLSVALLLKKIKEKSESNNTENNKSSIG